MAATDERVPVWRRRAAASAVAGAIGVGLREALAPRSEGPAVVIEAPDAPLDGDDGITLYFHPEVPEATLVLLRPRRA